MTGPNAETILPHELPSALERAGDGLKVLSLDCFDTLLWRDCHAPTDVFSALSEVTLAQRILAEQYARKSETALRKRNEVGIDAIYAQAMPGADKAQRAEAVSQEIEAESGACFAFSPTVELMRRAKARGLKVIIVSDTYLSARQLRSLIERAAGEEVAGLIDKVFASSQVGFSKSQGMLHSVLKAMKVKPGAVLHLGDNKKADFEGARALGIPALHLAQFDESALQRLRFERSCQQLVGDARDRVRGLMPHRVVLAQEEPLVEEPAAKLGLTVLGPVFHGFDQWLRKEAAALEKEHGGTVHWLFMLRDGHLPYIVHQAGGEARSTALVEISRFVAIASSLTSGDAYTQHYARELGVRPSTLARQMLFSDEEIASILSGSESDEQMVEDTHALLRELRKGQRQKITMRRARERAERLVAHVKARVKPKAGDTLMLVDLGYNGSAQDRIDGLLADAFNVHVAGRYLLLREKAATGLDKKGLIDVRHYDEELLEALCGNVAVIEQLATCELGSVVDFTPEGDPIRKEASVKGAQSDVRERVQAGAVRYARAANAGLAIRQHTPDQQRGHREGALGSLARFLFLPHARELAVLKSFEHDVNLGTERTVPLFDQTHAREAMRRRGLFYMEGSQRMFLPAELEGEDIHTRLSLLVQRRFGLGLTYGDTGQSSIAIPAFFMSKTDSAQTVIHAQPTHEGFYSARVPLAEGVESIGLAVGSVFEWFELANISAASIDTLKGGRENDARACELGAQYDAIKLHAPGIHECTDPAAFLLVKAPEPTNESDPQMIEFVMRPLIRRKSTMAAETAGPMTTIQLEIHKEQAA